MLELADVVFTLGRAGAERVLLRGADLRVADGETVLVAGLDTEARLGLAALFAGRARPRYGRVSTGRARTGVLGDQLASLLGGGDTAVLDAGDAPASEVAAGSLPASPGCAVVVLGGPGWRLATLPGRCRALLLDGGQLVDTIQEPAAGAAGSAGTGTVAGDGAAAGRQTTVGEIRMSLDELRRRTERALVGAGAGAATAASVASVLVDADRRGHRSHGVALLPTYLRRIRAGGIAAAAVPRLTALAPALASVDAGGGFGQPAAELAARWCATTAARHGLAAVAVHTNNHVGMLAAYRWPFATHGVIGLLLNTSAPSVAAPGASLPTLGSNAICLVTPTAVGSEPFCVDLGTGVVAAGKIRDAHNRRVRIPDGWLQDRYGRPTTDPAELDQEGSIPLFGGYKGLCVTLIAEILAGALAGGRVSPDVARQVSKLDQVMRCAQLFIGLSVKHFAGRENLDGLHDPSQLEQLVDRLRGAVLSGYTGAPPERPWFPDQREHDHAARADADGVTIPATVTVELGWDRL